MKHFRKAIKFMKRCYRKRILKETAEQKAEISPWMKDYELTELSSLYHEYLEMGEILLHIKFREAFL